MGWIIFLGLVDTSWNRFAQRHISQVPSVFFMHGYIHQNQFGWGAFCKGAFVLGGSLSGGLYAGGLLSRSNKPPALKLEKELSLPLHPYFLFGHSLLQYKSDLTQNLDTRKSLSISSLDLAHLINRSITCSDNYGERG